MVDAVHLPALRRTGARAVTRDVAGCDLQPGDVVVTTMPDGTQDTHVIDRFGPYPGRRDRGLDRDHVRRAYDAAGHWCATVPDHTPFHVQIGVDAG